MSDSQNPTPDQPQEPVQTPNVDLGAVMAALMPEFDKRFQGFQGLLDRRTSEFQRELEALKTADLTPEEREQLQASAAQERVKQLERENQMLKMRKQFPEEVDLLESFLGADSLESQLDILSKFRKAQAEAEAQGADPTEQPTPVDMNNPSRKTEPSLAEMGGRMTDDMANKILGSASEKGLLRRLRGG